MFKPDIKIIFKGNKNLFYISNEERLQLYNIVKVDGRTSKNCIIDIHRFSCCKCNSTIKNKQLINLNK